MFRVFTNTDQIMLLVDTHKKKMNKNDNFSQSILLRMLSVIFQKQNRSTRF